MIKCFNRVQLKELAIIKSGKRLPKGEEFSIEKTVHPYIRARDIKDGRIALNNPVYLTSDIALKLNKYTVNKGDVCITIVGANVGDVGAVPQFLNGANLTENAVKVIAREQTDQVFLKYALLTNNAQDQMKILAGGAAQPKLGIYKVETVEIPFPPLHIQRKIASMLSAYDDLIENNLRRIKILEEMAQNLYREWFVKFRFPGYENVRFVDSPLGRIPDGWEVNTIVALCSSLQDGDWIETKDQGGSDYRLLQVSNIGVGEFIETGNFRYVTEDTFNRLHCTEVVTGDILISRMPKPTGRAWLVTDMPWPMITAVDVAIARVDKKKAKSQFLVHHLNSAENLELVEKHQTGTTRPRISRKNLGALQLLVPPLFLQERFEQFASQTYELNVCLRRKNAVLRHTRDLLLPRLISGELDVSELDIIIPEGMT